MLRLRPYKACDAKAIVSWIGDETMFRKWCADRFESWPITAEDLNRHYAAGHLIMRFTDERKTILRFGFVIVDDQKRGMGYGKEMLQLAIRYAFDMLKAEKITLGVFENNEPAYRCYLAAGFRDKTGTQAEYYHIGNEDWKCLELEMDRPE